MSSYVLADGRDTGLEENLVAEVAGILRYFGCDLAPLEDDAAARAILQARAWELRRAAEEAAQERRHREAARETRTILDRAEARRRAREVGT